MDELYGILTAYELIIGIDNLPKGEETFKVIKKTNQNKKCHTNHDEESDEEEANFVKKNRKDRGSTKESYPSNILIVAELGAFKPSVLIPRKNLKVKMKKTNNTRKRENSTIRKITKKKNLLKRRQQFI